MNSRTFPSGAWVGFYCYQPSSRRHMMDLDLRFSAGVLRGDGWDDVGYFVVRGHYDEVSLQVDWVKFYPNSHSVDYRGCRDGRGIWGQWTMPETRGGFQIWPLSSTAAKAATLEQQEPLATPAPTEPLLLPLQGDRRRDEDASAPPQNHA